MNRGQTFGAACGAVATADDPTDAALAETLSVYPNRAREMATVAVEIAKAQAGPIRVEVYDVLGRRVAVLHDGEAAPGVTTLRLDALGLVPGVYLVRFSGGGTVRTERVTVVR